MAQDKGNPFLLTEVGPPIPGEDPFDRNPYILSTGSEHTQKRFGRGRQSLMDEFRAVLIADTDGQGFRR
jgi:hypothetical protein